MQLEIERLFGGLARRGVHDLERLRRAPAMAASGVAASSLSREQPMALITALADVRARLERLRAELRRLVDEG